MQASKWSTEWAMFRWVSRAPFGLPVVPEVYRITAVSCSSTAATGAGDAAPDARTASSVRSRQAGVPSRLDPVETTVDDGPLRCAPSRPVDASAPCPVLAASIAMRQRSDGTSVASGTRSTSSASKTIARAPHCASM